MPLKRFAAAGFFLAAALVAVVCFFGGCDVNWVNPGNSHTPDDTTSGTKPIDTLPYEPPIDTIPPPPTHDSRLVGDWQAIYDEDDGTAIEITTLTADGFIIEGGFLKVGDFWIENWELAGTWRTSNDTLYEEIFDGSGTDVKPPIQYAISGNSVTLRLCERRICDTMTSKRVVIDDIRSRLSAIRGQDSALYTNAGYRDLMWRLESNEDEIIDFDMMWFWYGERYFGDEWYSDEEGWFYDYDGRPYDPVWYTTGSRLFLILMSGGEVETGVELEYGVTGGGSAARLSIRPILADGTLGAEDIWLPADWEEWDGGLYKSKQYKKAAKKRASAFKRGGLGKRLAVVR
jgi:hypothetical protein